MRWIIPRFSGAPGYAADWLETRRKHLPPKSLGLRNKPWKVARLKDLRPRDDAVLGLVWIPRNKVVLRRAAGLPCMPGRICVAPRR